MLRIDLQAKTIDARGGFAIGAFVVGSDVAALGDPLVRIGCAGLADDGINVHERNVAGALHGALGRGGIPDVREDALVVESDQHLRGLVVSGGAAEIAACRKLGDLPAPGEPGHLAGVDTHAMFETEAGFDALEVETTGAVVAHGEFRPPVVDIDHPIGRQAACGPIPGVQNDESQLGGLCLKKKNQKGANKS